MTDLGVRVTPGVIRGSDMSAGVVAGRAAVVWIAAHVLGHDAARIGRALGGRSAAEIAGTLGRADLRRNHDTAFGQVVDTVVAALSDG